MKAKYGENVIPMPKHRDPPDILVNLNIAVEVRRLNQQFFEDRIPVGLENLSISLERALEEVLKSFDDLYRGKSYWVSIEYQRPLKSNIRKSKKEMRLALQNFLNLDAPNFPLKTSVNPEITLMLYNSNVGNGKLFRRALSNDNDAGGWVIGVYTDNIRYCINEKSLKISERLEDYSEWWLYLVDYIGLGLDQQDFVEVTKKIRSIGNFNKVVVLDYHGEKILGTIQM